MRLLGGLALLNAVLSAYEGLREAGLTDPGVAWAMRLVDLPSGALILAVVFARSRWRHGPLAVQVTLAAGAVHVAAAIVWPHLLLERYLPFQGVPYYLCLGALIATTARGERWERWIALAFLPRAFYFLTDFVILFKADGFSRGDVLLGELGALTLFGVSLIALVLLLMGDSRLPTPITVTTALVGPALALAQFSFADAPRSALLVISWLSLGLVRPLFLYLGLCRESIHQILSRSLACSGISAGVTFLILAGLGFPLLPALVVGLCAGLVAFGILDALDASGNDASEAPGAWPGPDGASPEAPTDGASALAPEPPQWSRLLVELKGSSRRGTDGLGEAQWTQKALAERTGISVKRVSEFPALVNGSAAQKMSQVPGWVPTPGRAPVLVETHKGAVRGASGAWVYYTLTHEGELLASHLAPTSVRSESGRIPPLLR